MLSSFLKNTIAWLLQAGQIALCAATFLAYLSPYISPEKAWIFIFIGTAYPWLLLGHFFLLVLRFFVKKINIWFSVVCILLGWTTLTRHVGVHFFSGKSKDALKVMTYNIGGALDSQDKVALELSIKGFLGEIAAYNPDILAIQELSNHTNRIIDVLKQKYPHIHNAQSQQVYIFSKFKILDGGKMPYSTYGNGTVFCDIQVKNKKIRVYSNHLYSNQVTGVTQDLIENADLESKQTHRQIRAVLRKVRNATYVRAKHSQQLAAHIKQCPYPVIVCGDFNETPQSYVYKTISKGLTDTFQAGGLGLGISYAGSIPLLKIDHIFVSPSMKTFRSRIGSKKYSDHYPVMAEVGLLNL